VGCRNGCEATAGQAKRQANTAPGLLSPQPEATEAICRFLPRHLPTGSSFGLLCRLRRGSRRSSLWRCSLGRDRCGYRPALTPSTKPLGRGAEKHAKGMIPHPDGGRHRFSGEKCRSKISKCSSAAYMGFKQRFPKESQNRLFGIMNVGPLNQEGNREFSNPDYNLLKSNWCVDSTIKKRGER